MASRRDQLQSYQFLVQRVLSAFVMRETDPPQSPLRRGIGAVFAGAMIAIIIAAGFAVFGLITKIGSGKWQVEGAVVVEKETGAPFLYHGGTLHPMVNYTSAVLASEQTPPRVFRESRRTLQRAPRGVMLGIPNAPSSLPDAKNTVGAPWTLCAVPGADVAGRRTTSTALILGTAMGGRRIGADEGLLVRDPVSNATHLIWHSHRYEIRGPNTVVSLFGAQTAPTLASAGWLSGLTIGAPITPINLPDAGQPSAAVSGRRVGELMAAQTATEQQFYVVMSDGLAPITELQKAIYTGQVNAEPVQISVFEANNTRKSTKLEIPAGNEPPPARPPKLVTAAATDSACAEFRDARGEPALSVVSGGRELTAGIPTSGALQSGTSLADRISIPSGKVALVRALPSPTAVTGAANIVTDTGLRYPVPTDQALRALALPVTKVVDMPAGLVNRIPPGPTLDADAARRPVDQQVRQPAR
jgi:type VII secretion protein EccB